MGSIWAIYTSSMNLILEVSLYLENERIGLLQHFQNDVPQSTSARDTFGKKETSWKITFGNTIYHRDFNWGV